MQTKYYVVAFVLSGLLSVQATTPDGDIDLNLAASYFDEAREQCVRDSGGLWGKSLCVPIAFVRPESRQVVTNEQDSAGALQRQGHVFVGTWPPELAIANSTQEWSGTKWSTVVWPPPLDRTARVALLLHESFHNIQEDLRFPAISPKNSHLGTRDGRLWLRMEWAALRAALKCQGGNRRARISDALLFRAYRRELFPGATVTERQMEMHEGLAEYTGLRLCGIPLSAAQAYLADTAFEWREKNPSFESSFAYFSGPAYGLLLDGLDVDWRTHLTPARDLGSLLQSALSITPAPNLEEAAEKLMILYEGESVRAEETDREREHLRTIENYRTRLIDGPVLIIPLQNMNIQYDPRNVMSLNDQGTIYPSIRISDNWGILTVTDNGALISPLWNQANVPAPSKIETNPIVGNGWSLELNEGWRVTLGDRTGDYMLNNSD